MIINHKKSGFTLIEMMVSVAIFTIVAVVVSVAFVNLSLLNKKAQVNRSLIDNVNLAMDVMSFKIREGRKYVVSNPTSNATQNNTLTFEDVYGKEIHFGLGYSGVDGNQCIEIRVDGGSSNCLTSPEVDISTLQFKRYFGLNWPREKISVRVRGTIKYRKIKSDFSLQANISQRNR